VGGLPSVVRAAPRRVRVNWLSTPRGASQVQTVGTTGNVEQAQGGAIADLLRCAARVHGSVLSDGSQASAERGGSRLQRPGAGNLVSYGEVLHVATGEVGRIDDDQAAALVGAVHPAQRSRMLELAQDPSGSHMVTSSPARFIRILVLDQLIKIMNACVMEFVDNPDQPRPRRGSQHVGEPGAEWPSVRQHGQHPL
jgi:hypothetical protein